MHQICSDKFGFIAVCASCNGGVLLKALSSNLASKPSPLFRYLGQRPKWRKRDKSFRGGVGGETLFQKGPPQLRGVHTAATKRNPEGHKGSGHLRPLCDNSGAVCSLIDRQG